MSDRGESDPTNPTPSAPARRSSGGEPAPAVDGAEPLYVVFVIDESGSMDETATVRVGNTHESTGQRVLGVVCTSVVAAMAVMPRDTLAGVVLFASGATRLSPIVPMTPENKATIKAALMVRQPSGSTNLEEGVRTAIDMLAEKRAGSGPKARFVAIVLTDGQPDAPLAGCGEAYGSFFRAYAARAGIRPEIYTCGFGYAVQVDLLVEIAKLNNGHFASIPTPQMVGTNFVNLMSQLLANESAPELDADADRLRLDFVSNAPEICRLARLGDGDGALALVRGLSMRIRAALAGRPVGLSNELLTGLLKDVEGEVAMALSDLGKNFALWGRGYIPSLARAHELKICANFKDPGLQPYAGPRFRAFQASAAEVFRAELADAISKMASAPAPSCRAGGAAGARARGGGGRHYRVSAAAISSLYDPSGGCFDGDCIVSMADGSTKPAKLVARGDVVRALGGAAARVVEIVRTRVSKIAEAVSFNSGLKITGWHPVNIEGRWVFPNRAPPSAIASAGTTAMVGLNVVYSFAVRGLAGEAPSAVHGMEVNGMLVATLGHEVEGDDVLSHSLYGTKKVLDAIGAMRAAAAAAGLPEPIVGDGEWAWAYDDTRTPVGIARC